MRAETGAELMLLLMSAMLLMKKFKNLLPSSVVGGVQEGLALRAC